MADISKRLEKAEKYLQRSKPEAALEEYLNILDDEPGNEQVRQAAADLCLALDRRSEAAELLSSLLEMEFESGETAKGSITYKKLCKITTPTLRRSGTVRKPWTPMPWPGRGLSARIRKNRRWPRASAWWNFPRPSKT